MRPVQVRCRCGKSFDAPESLAGGITNCPACGHAVEVPGLRDPYWRVLQGVAAVAWAFATAWTYVEFGATAAVVVAAALAGLLWLLSRAL